MGPESSDRLTVAVVADIPPWGVVAFRQYETAVLPLLDDHGGRLIHRNPSLDGRVEIHIIEFESHRAYESYLADERRTGRRPMLESSGATARVCEVESILDAHR